MIFLSHSCMRQCAERLHATSRATSRIDTDERIYHVPGQKFMTGRVYLRSTANTGSVQKPKPAQLVGVARKSSSRPFSMCA